MRSPKVKDIMTSPVVTVEPEDSIPAAARRLAEHRIAGAPVVKEGAVVGMLSEHDIVRAVLPPAPGEEELSALAVVAHAEDIRQRPTKKTVADVMSTLVVETSPDTDVWEAAGEMERRGVNRLPVVDASGTIVGIVSRADVVRVMGQQPEG